ncbi:MAG: cell division protein FtsA [Candidatus Omnitrophica bacterium]|nr:cell division protein FtsA [Candidatus Omnitrophota bacterium]
MNSDIVCGLDIGASSVRVLIAQPVDDRVSDRKDAPPAAQEKILAYSEAVTKGFSKGVVSNLNLLSDVIEDAVSKAEDAAHCKVRKVITNVAGVHIRTFKSRGSIHISDRPLEITEEDLKRCIESAKLIAMSLDREVVHLIPERFYIDDKLEITEPVGLFGSKLDVDLNIVTTLVSILQNVTKAVNLAGYEVDEVICSGAGTALAIFNKRELEEGAVIIDIGKDHTEASLFTDEKLKDCFYFPFGSDDLTQVLQDRLRIGFDEAEELRIKYGMLTKSSSGLYDDTEIPLPSMRIKSGSGYGVTQSDRNGSGGNWVDSKISAGARSDKDGENAGIISRREISNLLFPKVEEIMQDVYKRIEPFLRQKKSLPHIRVVGGLSRMDGFVEAVEETFGVRVDIGSLHGTKDLRDLSFAGSLGLVRYGMRNKPDKKQKYFNAHSLAGRFIAKARELLSEYF